MNKKSRLTKQKIFLQKLITEKKTFTAKDIYQIAKNQKIGIATIYRFINNLLKKKKIHKYNCNNSAFFSTNNELHVHFTCEICEKIEHIKSINQEKISEILMNLNLNKLEICHVQIDLFGICSNCKKRENNGK
ncbi:MAG: transcriptional repressor [Candidatus Anstonellales archaeon]